MKVFLGWTIFALWSAAAAWAGSAAEIEHKADPLDACNVAWVSPSKDSSGSMPVGNGDIGLNVWVESDGDLLFYLSKTDAWNENQNLLKLGRVRVALSPNPFAGGNPFRQTLRLRQGEIEIRGGKPQAETTIRAWVDANRPAVRLEADGKQEFTLRASLEMWRKELRAYPPPRVPNAEVGAFDPILAYPDTLVEGRKDQVVWYHRNPRSIWASTFQLQDLAGIMNQYKDPLIHHTFGGLIEGPGMVSENPGTLQSAAAGKRFVLSITVLAQQTATPEQWLAGLDEQAARVRKVPLEQARAAHRQWWNDFWNRSWIRITGTEDAATVTRGYTLQRWMNACGGRGGSPIKFNGSIFTSDWHGDPDYRQWHGSYWFQNTRLIYWPMMASGDFDLMGPLFRMYRDALPLARQRTKTYFKHDGAFFYETMTFWGSPLNRDYGFGNGEWSRRGMAPGIPQSGWVRRFWGGGLELAAMMLDYFDYTQDNEFARSTGVPFAAEIVTFYDQHWGRNREGKIRFDPAQANETWWQAVNPMTEVAGLKFVLGKLLKLPIEFTTEPQREQWLRLLAELPPVPTRVVQGKTILAPADEFRGRHNIENVELYAVFPFRLYGVGKPELELARDTFRHRWNRTGGKGDDSDDFESACLGMASTARNLLATRFGPKYLRPATGDQGARFPAFWHGGYDWRPDQCHGGGGMIALEAMLMQCEGEKILLFPAWPKERDVEFKLRAPYQTTVEGVLHGEKLEGLKVTPAQRRKDLVVLPAQ